MTPFKRYPFAKFQLGGGFNHSRAARVLWTRQSGTKWFQVFFVFTPISAYLGKWSNWTNIFQMGWFNHQQNTTLMVFTRKHGDFPCHLSNVHVFLCFFLRFFVQSNVVNGCQVVPDISCAVSCSPSSARELGLDSWLVVMIFWPVLGWSCGQHLSPGSTDFCFMRLIQPPWTSQNFLEEPFLCKIPMPRRYFWCVQKDV